MKELFADLKKKSLGIAVAIIIGFCLGKIYTWDTIITDCKVLGSFRIANTAFYCKLMAPVEAPK